MPMDHKYLLGIEELDIQHADIFAVLENLRRISSDNERIEERGPLLTKLHDLLVAHFDYEESFMGTINCPDRHRHEDKHSELRAMMDVLIGKASQTQAERLRESTFGEKLSAHLLEYDVGIGLFVEYLIEQLRVHEVGERHALMRPWIEPK